MTSTTGSKTNSKTSPRHLPTKRYCQLLFHSKAAQANSRVKLSRPHTYTHALHTFASAAAPEKNDCNLLNKSCLRAHAPPLVLPLRSRNREQSSFIFREIVDWKSARGPADITAPRSSPRIPQNSWIKYGYFGALYTTRRHTTRID